jgi:hypothetical protein
MAIGVSRKQITDSFCGVPAESINNWPSDGTAHCTPNLFSPGKSVCLSWVFKLEGNELTIRNLSASQVR